MCAVPLTPSVHFQNRWELMDCKHPQRGCVPDEYFFKLLPVAARVEAVFPTEFGVWRR